MLHVNEGKIITLVKELYTEGHLACSLFRKWCNIKVLSINMSHVVELDVLYRKDSCISRTFLLKFWAKKWQVRLIHETIPFRESKLACCCHKLN